MPIISIIAAHDDQLGIGKKNKLPWHIPEDLKHFKKLTIGHPVIMGRITFESIGKPLPGRTNIIITRNRKNIKPFASDQEVFIVHSFNQALKLAKTKDNQEIFIIGGGKIYKLALPLADKLYITHVKGNFNCDTFFPDYSNFNLVASKELSQKLAYSVIFLTLTK